MRARTITGWAFGLVTIPLALAVLGVTLALIGPGQWSVDARLYGRKHYVSRDL